MTELITSADDAIVEGMKFYRRNFVTHKRFQYGFILYLGIFGGLLGLMNSWIQLYLSRPDTERTLLVTILTVGGVALVVFVPIGLVSLVFSNRIAGPLKRFQNHLEAVARGETLEGFKFREKDFFRDLEKPYNEILERLRNSGQK
jgi:methyl-accepting chemotaxis protein